MKPAEKRYRGFACPQEELDEAFLRGIAVEYARGFTSLFLEKYKIELDRRGQGLSPLLEKWLKQEEDFDTVWDVAFASVRKAVLFHDPSSVLRRAATLGLRLHQRSLPGHWCTELGPPTRLRWGKWLLPKASWISVSCSEKRASIRTRHRGDETLTTLWRIGHEWHAAGADDLPVVNAEKYQLILFFSNALDSIEFAEGKSIVSEVRPERIASASREAVSLLRTHASPYLRWVARVIRCVIPVHAKRSMIRSGSDFDLPGTIQMSFRTSAVALAEMLVHEASHQYFHVLCRLGDLTDGTDSQLYYSPVKRMKRSIYNILLAYHAFANVLLFYRLCRANGLDDDGYALHNEEDLIPQLEQLETPLRTTDALTPLGRALWKPLAARIH
jgi:hypothetical protein